MRQMECRILFKSFFYAYSLLVSSSPRGISQDIYINIQSVFVHRVCAGFHDKTYTVLREIRSQTKKLSNAYSWNIFTRLKPQIYTFFLRYHNIFELFSTIYIYIYKMLAKSSCKYLNVIKIYNSFF